MKKITNSVRTIVAMILLIATVLTANAQNVGDRFKVGELYYKITNTSPKEVEAVSQKDNHPYWDQNEKPKGDLIIPATVEFKTENYSVTSISECVLVYCPVNNITVPKSVTNIKGKAFYSCLTLKKIEVEQGNTAYCSEDGILFSKDKTELLRFPPKKEKVTYNIPNSVIKIREYAFASVILESVTIPKSVKEIGKTPFWARNLKEINVEQGNTTYCSEDGVLFNKDKTKLIMYPKAKTAKNYTIPNGVVEICGSAFFIYSEYLNSITIPNSVTSIRNNSLRIKYLTSIISKIEDIANVQLEHDIFFGIDKKTCTLFVPKGTVNEYKKAEQWKKFENIKEIDTGIIYTKLTNPISVDGNNITVSQVNNKKVILYNLSGKVLYNLHATQEKVTLSVPQAGTYILQVDNGTRKIVVN